MATNSIRRTQRAIAVNRLTAASTAASETFGIDAVEIPTFNKDPEYLVTLQIEAAADVLEAVLAVEPVDAEPLDLSVAYGYYQKDERRGGKSDKAAFDEAFDAALNPPPPDPKAKASA